MNNRRSSPRFQRVNNLLMGGLCLALVSSQASAGQGHELSDVLAKVRAAVGIGAAPSPVALEFTGRAAQLESEGTGRCLLLTGGRYLYETESQLPMSSAYDGERALERDWSGTPLALQLGDREVELLGSWFASGYWLDPAAELEIELRESPESEAPGLTVKLPEGQYVGEVALDAESWLPHSLTLSDWNDVTTTTLTDWRKIGGRSFAFQIDSVSDSGETSWFDFEAARALDAAPKAPFAAISAPASGTRFLEDVSAEVDLDRAPTGHLLIPALVDGEDRGWFILDTGAGTLCISPDVADSADMEAFGEVRAVGVAGETRAGFRRGKSLTVGPLVLDDPTFLELDLAFLEPIFGVKIAGVCGFEAFQRAVFEIDLGQELVYISDPRAAPARDTTWSPLLFEGRIPCFPASFEGDHQGLFRFDSGSNSNVEFDADTVTRLGLTDDRELTASQVGGVGGWRTVDLGELGWIQIGGRRYMQFTATFSRPGATAKVSPFTDGVFGLGLVDRHTLVFDYQNGRFAFRLPSD